jgi:hypothetical protein
MLSANRHWIGEFVHFGKAGEPPKGEACVDPDKTSRNADVIKAPVYGNLPAQHGIC